MTDASIESIRAAMHKQPARHRSTTFEAITALARDIREMQSRGYTLAEIAALLESHGVAISPRTLARHLAATKTASRTPNRASARAGKPAAHDIS